MKKTLAEAETILNQNQFYLFHQFYGFGEPLDKSQYEIQDMSGNVIIDHLSEGQVISISEMLPQLPQKETIRMSDTEELMIEYVRVYNIYMSLPDDDEIEKLSKKLRELEETLTRRFLFENGYKFKRPEHGIFQLFEKE